MSFITSPRIVFRPASLQRAAGYLARYEGCFELLIEEITQMKFKLIPVWALVDGPISAETVSPDAPGMVDECRDVAKLHKNIVLKCPMTREGLKARIPGTTIFSRPSCRGPVLAYNSSQIRRLLETLSFRERRTHSDLRASVLQFRCGTGVEHRWASTDKAISGRQRVCCTCIVDCR